MNRGPLAAIQHRKFPLLIRWKTALKQSASFQVLPPPRFPHKVIFRAFNEVVRLMKLVADGSSLERGKPHLFAATDDIALSPDQYMDVFLVGREVLAVLLSSDGKLVARYTSEVRNQVRHNLDVAIRHLIDREMRAYRSRSDTANGEARIIPEAPPGRPQIEQSAPARSRGAGNRAVNSRSACPSSGPHGRETCREMDTHPSSSVR